MRTWSVRPHDTERTDRRWNSSGIPMEVIDSMFLHKYGKVVSLLQQEVIMKIAKPTI